LENVLHSCDIVQDEAKQFRDKLDNLYLKLVHFTKPSLNLDNSIHSDSSMIIVEKMTECIDDFIRIGPGYIDVLCPKAGWNVEHQLDYDNDTMFKSLPVMLRRFLIILSLVQDSTVTKQNAILNIHGKPIRIA